MKGSVQIARRASAPLSSVREGASQVARVAGREPRGASRAQIELAVLKDQITIGNRGTNPNDKPAHPARRVLGARRTRGARRLPNHEKFRPTRLWRDLLRRADPNRSSGGCWIRTNVGVSRQVYSLLPLAARATLRGVAESSCRGRAGGGTRTPNHLLTKQVLYQLSYASQARTPAHARCCARRGRRESEALVVHRRFRQVSSRSSRHPGRRSGAARVGKMLRRTRQQKGAPHLSLPPLLSAAGKIGGARGGRWAS